MKTIFLHIGLHKTGTTTIQESLFAEQEKLNQNGVLVPAVGQPFPQNAGHHNLAWELFDFKKFSAKNGTWDDLIYLINEVPHKRIILSSEEFTRIPVSKIEQIKIRLEKFQVKIVVYIRRQDKILQSFWAEMIKSGRTPNFTTGFIEWLENNQYIFSQVDFQSVLKRWSDVFGKDNLILRVLERNQLQVALFHDFLLTCGVKDFQKYTLHGDRNISPSMKELVLIQELKKKLANQMDELTAIQFFHWIRQYAGEQGWNTNQLNLVDKELYNSIMSVYENGNHIVAREYFGRDILFFEPFEEKEVTRFEVKDFHSDELLDIFIFLLGKMSKKKFVNSELGVLERQYQAIEAELDAIHASRGWKWLQRLRALRRKVRNLFTPYKNNLY